MVCHIVLNYKNIAYIIRNRSNVFLMAASILGMIEMEKTSDILRETTDTEKGLTSGEVQERIIAHGYNEIPEKKEHSGSDFSKSSGASHPGCWK